MLNTLLQKHVGASLQHIIVGSVQEFPGKSTRSFIQNIHLTHQESFI